VQAAFYNLLCAGMGVERTTLLVPKLAPHIPFVSSQQLRRTS